MKVYSSRMQDIFICKDHLGSTQVLNKALDQVGHPLTPKVLVQEESEVPEPQQLSIVPPQPKPMVVEQPLPQV